MTPVEMKNQDVASIGSEYAEKYGFKDPVEYFHSTPKGLNHEVIEMMSRMKG